jgi:hypothetical protein
MRFFFHFIFHTELVSVAVTVTTNANVSRIAAWQPVAREGLSISLKLGRILDGTPAVTGRAATFVDRKRTWGPCFVIGRWDMKNNKGIQ